jgi:hypothetical protein
MISALEEGGVRNLWKVWHDRPDLWRSLLTASESPNPVSLRRTERQALQLITGNLITSKKATGTAG